MKPRSTKIAAVSFINTVPLIAGLEEYPSIELIKAVPASLLIMLKNRKADVALIPSIDYQLAKFDLRIIRAGAIGSLAHSLTVRIFSKVPVEQIKTLSCDTDSHTSVILARIVLKELYNIAPEISRYTYAGGEVNVDTDAILLIGDKVINASIAKDFQRFQLDLVEAWRKLTGLGFVFAVWACRPGFKADEIKMILQRVLSVNLKKLETLARKHASLHHLAGRNSTKLSFQKYVLQTRLRPARSPQALLLLRPQARPHLSPQGHQICRLSLACIAVYVR